MFISVQKNCLELAELVRCRALGDNLEAVEAHSLRERAALADLDNVTNIDAKRRRHMHSN